MDKAALWVSGFQAAVEGMEAEIYKYKTPVESYWEGNEFNGYYCKVFEISGVLVEIRPPTLQYDYWKTKLI